MTEIVKIDPKSSAFRVANNGAPVVTIRQNGEVKIAEGVSLSEAARLFWEAVSAEYRAMRSALQEQWEIAHDEHCGNSEDCTTFGGKHTCHHPKPAALTNV